MKKLVDQHQNQMQPEVKFTLMFYKTVTCLIQLEFGHGQEEDQATIHCSWCLLSHICQSHLYQNSRKDFDSKIHYRLGFSLRARHQRQIDWLQR